MPGKDKLIPYREPLAGDYSVSHKKTRSNEKSQFHIHDAFEVLLSLSPGLKLETGSKTYILPRYSLMLFNNMDMHLLSLMDRSALNERCVVYFRPEYINGFSTENTALLECFMLRPNADANVLALDKRTALELARDVDNIIVLQASQGARAYGNDLEIRLRLAEFLLKVNRIYRDYHGMTGAVTGQGFQTVYSIISHMHQNYGEAMSLDQLARRFFINKYSMCSLFREVTGMSPLQYLIHCRLLKARELLLLGVAVDEVCGRVGYNNLSHFSRAFKAKVGISPKQYQMSRKEDAARP